MNLFSYLLIVRYSHSAHFMRHDIFSLPILIPWLRETQHIHIIFHVSRFSHLAIRPLTTLAVRHGAYRFRHPDLSSRMYPHRSAYIYCLEHAPRHTSVVAGSMRRASFLAVLIMHRLQNHLQPSGLGLIINSLCTRMSIRAHILASQRSDRP